MATALPRPAAAPAAAPVQAPTQQAAPVKQEAPKQQASVAKQEAPKQEAPKVELKPWETAKHKLTANGKEFEVDYKELQRRAALGYGAEEQMKKAVAETRQAQDAINLIKTNPEKAFELLGIDKKEWAKKMLLEAAEMELMSPEERALRQREAEVNEKGKKYEEREALEAQQRQAALYQQEEAKLATQTIDAMKTHKVPQTKETVKRIGQKMLQYVNAGYTNVTPADVMPEIIRDYQQDLQALVGGANEEMIEQFLGPDIAKRLIKAKNKELEQSQNRAMPKLANPVRNQKVPATQMEKKLTPREWRQKVTGGKMGY